MYVNYVLSTRILSTRILSNHEELFALYSLLSWAQFSKAVTVVLMHVMSVAKCAYLLVLSMFRCEMFTSRGAVSSNMWNLLFTLSQMLTYYPKANTLSISHMGQFLQGGENGSQTSLFFKLELLCGQTKRF